MKNRRKHFLINKPMQLRYMLVVSLPLFLVSAVALFALYMSIWGGVLESFTNEKVQSDLLTAARMAQYEQVRYETPTNDLLSVFKAATKLTQQQRQVFSDILKASNKQVGLTILIILGLIAWGTIYISHRIAGPLYHMSRVAEELENGNYTARVCLRKHDEAQQLADKLNAAFTGTEQRFIRIREATQNSDLKLSSEAVQKEISELKLR